MKVTVLSGGVGAARMLGGIVQVVDPTDVTAVVNTGDDTELHGLTICPDLDTITYTLAGAIDPERGWGLVDETWRAIEGLDRYARVRPPGSAAATTWFNLGDRDLATHLYRTARLREGARLTDVTAEIAAAWDVRVRLLPMSEDRFRTRLRTRDGDLIDFQEYFVRLRHSVPVSEVVFDHDGAEPSPEVRSSLETADVVVIAPSNPLVSVAPVRALPGVDDTLTARRDSVAAVSPIVGGAALKGPADRMLRELGLEPSAVGVAELYRQVAGTLVIDRVDAELAPRIEELGLRCLVTDTIMVDPAVSAELARVTLGAVISD